MARSQDRSASIPQISKDYGSPIIEISGNVFDLKNNWIVPSGSGGIAEMGAWIRPNAAGYSLLAAAIFELNDKALSINYEKPLSNLIELSHSKLPNDAGQLFKFDYNYNAFGTPDVNSIRFMTMGIGSTPEQSLAFGPIDQISQQYTENAVFPIKSEHFVWIYKKNNGSLTISTIKEPFISNLRAKALEIKLKMLENPMFSSNNTDENTKIFDIANKWINHAVKYRQQLDHIQKIQLIESLNRDLKLKQDEFNSLRDAYNNILLENKNLTTVIQFIDVCQVVTSSLSRNNASRQPNDKAVYIFMSYSLDINIKDLSNKMNNISKEINVDLNNLKRVYNESSIPLPLP